jgi:hypothetical protein
MMRGEGHTRKATTGGRRAACYSSSTIARGVTAEPSARPVSRWGRGEATSHRPGPAGQGAITPLSPEPRTSDQTRASVQPTSGRATRSPFVVTLRGA